MRKLVLAGALVAATLSFAGCDGGEAARVPVRLFVDGDSPREVTTDEGWTVLLDEARLGMADLRFRRGGEAHASWITPISRWLLPSAHAHPGHTVGGEVVGEALGTYAVDFFAASDEPFAEASTLAADADALDFMFASLDVTGAPGAAAVFTGTATRGDAAVRFEAFIVQDDGRRVDGVPLALDVRDQGATDIALALLLESDAGASLFDSVDFAALPYPRADDVARVEPGTAEHNRIRNALQSFEHYRATVRD